MCDVKVCQCKQCAFRQRIDAEGRGMMIGQPEDSHMRAIRSLRGDCADLMAERDQLKAENESLRKDAERYQWLRDKSENLHGFYLSTPIWMTGVKFSKENVDSTIDGAMGKGEQQ